MKIWLMFIGILAADMLLLIAAIVLLLDGNWLAWALLLAIGLAGTRYFTYRLEHGP